MTEALRLPEGLEGLKPTGVKYLKLVQPTLGHSLTGKFSESPTFVSPSVRPRHADGCHGCRAYFKPVVYKEKEITIAHHFHEDDAVGGGIYYSEIGTVNDLLIRGDLGETLISGYESYGWVANITPLGYGVNDRRGWTRSLAVITDEVFAFCIGPNCSTKPYPQRLVDEGLLRGDDLAPSSHLSPVCFDDSIEIKKSQQSTFPLAFRKTPQGISFSSV